MPYKTLDKLFHANTSSQRKSENQQQAQERLTAPSTFRTGIDVGTGELFLAVPRELSLAMEKVLRAEREVSRLWRELPDIACGAYLRNLIIDEVVCTNQMEGVHSTRRQIKEALDSIEDKTAEGKRIKQFREFANLYLGLTGEHPSFPQTPADIRTLYDSVVAGTLNEGDAPDGELFRAGGVDIRSASDRVTHRGVEPEAAIVRLLEKMIDFVSSENIPELYSALLSHFLFEYIHPFYDGNGRTGRFLLALYLGVPLSLPTTLSLSRVIAQNKGAYYKAFTATENPLNHGEATFFVLQMMELIGIAQGELVSELSMRKDALAEAENSLEKISADSKLSEQASNALYQMVQVSLFGMYSEVSLRDIATHLSLTSQSARKYTYELQKAALVEPVSLRPLTFTLTSKAKKSFGM